MLNLKSPSIERSNLIGAVHQLCSRRSATARYVLEVTSKATTYLRLLRLSTAGDRNTMRDFLLKRPPAQLEGVPFNRPRCPVESLSSQVVHTTFIWSQAISIVTHYLLWAVNGHLILSCLVGRRRGPARVYTEASSPAIDGLQSEPQQLQH